MQVYKENSAVAWMFIHLIIKNKNYYCSGHWKNVWITTFLIDYLFGSANLNVIRANLCEMIINLNKAKNHS